MTSMVHQPVLASRLWCSLLVGLLATVHLTARAAESAADPILQLKQISESVYAVIGPLDNRTPENLANNASFGFIVTDDGVVLIDSGGSYKGAAAIDSLIRQVTDKPVTLVINTGGQDHRWLGNGYFKEHGAQIIASRDAVADQRDRYQDELFVLRNLIGEEALAGTDPVYADEVFDSHLVLTRGDVTIELHHTGPAHTPGDSDAWLPEQRIVFTGDIVFTERMLGVLPFSSSSNWIAAFDAIDALQPVIVVPGHGDVTDIDRARADTRDYLQFLRDSVGEFMESGGDITDIGTLDQTSFAYLLNYEQLKGRNAQQVFQEMEWE